MENDYMRKSKRVKPKWRHKYSVEWKLIRLMLSHLRAPVYRPKSGNPNEPHKYNDIYKGTRFDGQFPGSLSTSAYGEAASTRFVAEQMATIKWPKVPFKKQTYVLPGGRTLDNSSVAEQARRDAALKLAAFYLKEAQRFEHNRISKQADFANRLRKARGR